MVESSVCTVVKKQDTVDKLFRSAVVGVFPADFAFKPDESADNPADAGTVVAVIKPSCRNRNGIVCVTLLYFHKQYRGITVRQNSIG